MHACLLRAHKKEHTECSNLVVYKYHMHMKFGNVASLKLMKTETHLSKSLDDFVYNILKNARNSLLSYL